VAKPKTEAKRKVCDACDKVRSKRSMSRVHRFFPLWTCQRCSAVCCDHYCSLKNGNEATCGNCQRETSAFVPPVKRASK
jgi:hypothetical protein